LIVLIKVQNNDAKSNYSGNNTVNTVCHIWFRKIAMTQICTASSFQQLSLSRLHRLPYLIQVTTGIQLHHQHPDSQQMVKDLRRVKYQPGYISCTHYTTALIFESWH